MKICIVSNMKESGYGETTRPYFLSKELVKYGHQVLHLCQMNKPREHNIQYYNISHLQQYPPFFTRLIEFVFAWYVVIKFKPDIVYAHQFNNARWALATKIFHGIIKVFDAHTSVYFESINFGNHPDQVQYVRSIESNICKQSDYIIAASINTKNILIEEYKLSEQKICVIGNGTYFEPINFPVLTNNKSFICSCTLPFDGFKSNEMALEFLFEIANHIYHESKEVVFHVIGGGSKPKPKAPNIIYTGYVTDLKSHLLESDLCIAPYPNSAVCGGIRNKVCDYLALGKAIVSSSEGMRGFFDLNNGVHYLEANTAEDFSSAIMRIKNDAILRRKLELNALQKAPEYLWTKRGRQLNDFLNSIKPDSTATPHL